MNIHPAVAFGTVIVGASLLGVVGTLLAVPVAATVQAFVSTYIRRHELVDSELLDDVEPDDPVDGEDLEEEPI
jgi:predicted PurR-regulated permease PerM